MMEQVGEIYQDDRDIYLVMRKDGDVYYFEPGSFYQGLTRYATKGCKIKDIEKLMPAEDEPEEAEGLK